MFGCLVTATDTGVGKTVLSGALAAALRAQGLSVAAFKPVLTGADEPPGQWPADDELLASVTGQAPEQVCPSRLGPAVSPHLAAALAGTVIEPASLLRAARQAGRDRDALVVEGVGGLLVPLTPEYLVRDFAGALGLPLVIAARPGLGTINHTLLTVEAARSAQLTVSAVVLTPWPAQPDAMLESNRATIARLGEVEVATLGPIAARTPEALAAAGAQLEARGWMGSDRAQL
jgi:dethiobiotin synthetase